ncbi:Hypothetical protein POVN_LOCUS32 [uncultured virus]|nr:Hypothetical protein POVN_LOCUS32 [uncultured virus]
MPAGPELFRLVFAFVWGLLMGPLSSGFIYTFIMIILLEFYAAWATSMEHPQWRFVSVVAINLAGIAGWVLGRWLILGETGLEHLDGLPYKVFGYAPW